MNNIYETEAFFRVHNGSMHPGGLRLTDRAVRLAGLEGGMRAADIGCGTGATAAYLKEKYKLDVVGLDISETLIGVGLERNPDLKLLQWGGGALPFENESLDAVFFECTLSVLGDARFVLAHAAKALKTGGVAIISDVYAKQRTGAIKPSLSTPDELTEALASAGFDILVIEDHTAALRTFAAELREKTAASEISCLYGASCHLQGLRLSDLGYILIIAKKTGE